MTYLSILDKLIIFFNLLKESSSLLIFVGIIVVSIVLRVLGKINNKKLFYIIILSLFGTFFLVFLMNYEILSKTFDNFWNVIFTNIYFPSIYVYLFMIISTYVITIVTFFQKKISRFNKIINYSMSFLLNLLLLLNLNIIAKDKIDIFSTSSLYTNINLVSMLELSMNIYILWMIIVSANYIIHHVTEFIIIKKENKNLEASPVKLVSNAFKKKVEDYGIQPNSHPLESNLSISSPIQVETLSNDSVSMNSLVNMVTDTDSLEIKEEEIVSYEPKFINSTVVEQVSDDTESASLYTFNQYVHKENKNVEPVVNSILDQILNNTLPLQKEEIVNKKETFTLNDYKTFSKMLKEVIKMNNHSTLNMRDMLNSELLVKFGYEDYSLFQRMLHSYMN